MVCFNKFDRPAIVSTIKKETRIVKKLMVIAVCVYTPKLQGIHKPVVVPFKPILA
jgi:hypothetical protein